MIPNLARHPILWFESGIFQYLLKPPMPMRRLSSIESLDPQQRILSLGRVGQAYKGAFQRLGDKGFFPRGQIETISRRLVASNELMSIEELSWASDFQPVWSDDDLHSDLKSLGFDRNMSFREKFLQAEANSRCHARRYFRKTGQPRPVLIALHGYGGGHFRAEEWMWHIRESLDQGFDLVIMVLPYHGPRMESRRRYLPPRFPSRDVRFTIEALRQTYFDFAALHDWLRREGAIHVGLAGVSLGAYCAALIATLDRQLSSLIHVTPLGCMATLSDRQSRFIGTQSEQHEQRDVFGRVFDPVNPLRRKPLVDPDGVIVIAGEGDGITGLHHARLLADHFQCAQQTFPGGHIIRSGFRKAWIQALKQCQSTIPV